MGEEIKLMTVDILTYAAGILVSLAFAYMPKLKTWYDAQGDNKGLVMLAALALVAGAAFGFSCAGWFDVPVTCDKPGLESLLVLFIKAVVANQATFLTVVKPRKP